MSYTLKRLSYPVNIIELVAATLNQCGIGKTKHLIINLPPRTLKSHAASVAFRLAAVLLGPTKTSPATADLPLVEAAGDAGGEA